MVEGQFLMNSEVVWIDPSCLFEKYRESLLSVDDDDSRPLCRYSLQPLYSDKKSFFCGQFGVPRSPSVDEFVHLLVHVVRTTTVQRGLEDAINLFATIGKALAREVDDVASSNSLKKSIVDVVRSERVVPTKNGVWVGLDKSPMIADNKQLEKMFASVEEVFFVEYGEKIGVGSTHRKGVMKGTDCGTNIVLKITRQIKEADWLRLNH